MAAASVRAGSGGASAGPSSSTKAIEGGSGGFSGGSDEGIINKQRNAVRCSASESTTIQPSVGGRCTRLASRWRLLSIDWTGYSDHRSRNPGKRSSQSASVDRPSCWRIERTAFLKSASRQTSCRRNQFARCHGLASPQVLQDGSRSMLAPCRQSRTHRSTSSRFGQAGPAGRVPVVRRR